MKKFLSILSCLTLMLMIASAQNVPFTKEAFKDDKEGFKKAKDALREGDDFYERGEFIKAISPYAIAQAFNPNNDLLNYKLGCCVLVSAQPHKSLPFLQKALELNPTVDKNILANLGKAYQLNLMWDKAISCYSDYLKNTKPEKEKADNIAKWINECENGKELVANPVRVFIDNVGPAINSSFPDYTPVISADESQMVFTSRRDNSTGGGHDPFDNLFYEDVYISYKQKSNWSDAKNMMKPINTEFHDASVALAPDGQTMIMYKGDNNGDLYECKLKGNEWSKPQSMPGDINSRYHESAASLSADGKMLFFVSDRKDGTGGRDIYFCVMDVKGKWGKAINLGAPINTSYDEDSPFIHPDGKTLYFASRGHNSMGGYDLFKSINENGKWSQPVNIGYPINTPGDDVYLVVAANGKHGYYASFRTDGLGDKDIYLITFLGPEKQPVLNNEDNLLASVASPIKQTVIAPAVTIKEAKLTLLKGTVVDAFTTKPLEAMIELVDNEKNETIATFSSNSSTGKYLVSLPAGRNYGIAVKAEGYLFHSENFDIPDTANFQEVTKDVQLKNVAVGSVIVLKNIFFDFDKATLRPASANELERLIKLLNDVPSLVIEISGHTDNKGKADYNQRLSEERAKAVVEYLIHKGIAKERLEYKGYGLAMPVATNDTDEGRQENRRTEFKILKK